MRDWRTRPSAARATRRSLALVAGLLSASGCGGPPALYGDLPDLSGTGGGGGGGGGGDGGGPMKCNTPCDCIDGQPVDRGPANYMGEKSGKPTANGDASQHDALVWANHWRTAIGLKALDGNDKIEQAAAAHAAYNAMAMGGCNVGAHSEKMGCPGFTGVDPGAREMAAGYGWSTYGEVVFSSGMSAQTAVSWWVFSVYHRLPFVNFQLLEMGAGHDTQYVIDFGTQMGKSGKKPSAPVVFPPPGSTMIPGSFDGRSEGPMPPAPPDTGMWPSGVPISIHFNGDSFTIDEHHLYNNAKGACSEAAHAYFNGDTDPNLKNFAPDAAFFYGNMPLAGATEYVMSVVGTHDGKPYKRAWAFTTQ
jgi:uncharacterized protein YkwD